MITKIAKTIRFITVPPIVVTVELILLLFFEDLNVKVIIPVNLF